MASPWDEIKQIRFTPCKGKIIFAKEFILPFQGAIWNMALFTQPVGIGLGYEWFSTIFVAERILISANFCNFFEKLYLCNYLIIPK